MRTQRWHMARGRNDACPCGSGKKFKKCHFQVEAPTAALESGHLEEESPAISLAERRAMEAMVEDIALMASNRHRPMHRAVDAAQELVYEAWEASGARRLTLAGMALSVSANCADAYVLLAEEGELTEEEATDAYARGVAAGKRALGRDVFMEEVGHFWGILETRPYMRALHGLAQSLWHRGLRPLAIERFAEMLRLNPNDNQGARYQLAACLLEENRNDDLEKLLRRYEKDGSAYWAYARALLAFRQVGDAPSSRTLLNTAISVNRHVPSYLTGRKKMPMDLPEFVGFGDENEAIAYAEEHAFGWMGTPGALTWLLEATGVPTKPKRRRLASPDTSGKT
jgi:tetratricopeptide (TPR) repeat protein